MNKKNLIYLLLIITGAILLRLWNLDKPEGMWNDEYFTWKIASAKFPFDFFEALKTNCHAPLHYLYLKAWMFFFHDEDKILRLSSVVPGVLGVITMFFAGGQIVKKDSAPVSIGAALVCAISAFLIYFSQEVRIYSLLFFLSTLVLYFALKIFNNPSKKNFFFYSLFSLLVVLCHTIGFVFVTFSTAALFAFGVSKKKAKDYVFLSVIGVILLSVPFIPLIMRIFIKSGVYSQWWAPFNFSRTLFFFTDAFSPVLNDITHVYNTFTDALYKDGFINFGYLIFAVVPAAIGIMCLIRALISPDKKRLYLIFTTLCTILTVLIAAMTGKLVFATKYMTEIIPFLILLSVYGLTQFKSKAFKIIVATVFVVINLFFVVVSNTSPVRIIRDEGQRIPVVSLQKLGLKKNDQILVLYYPRDRFYKYIDEKNPDNAPLFRAHDVSKYTFGRYLKKGLSYTDSYKIGKEVLRDVFRTPKCSDLDYCLNDLVFSKIKAGEKFFIVDLTTVSFFPMDVINQVAEDETAYKNAPLLYLAMSYIKEFALERAKRELVYDGYYNAGAWRIYVFKKV